MAGGGGGGKGYVAPALKLLGGLPPLPPSLPTPMFSENKFMLKTNILYYTEHTLSNYWFYDPVM